MVVEGEDVGIWKRVVSANDVRVTVWPDATLGRDEVTAIGEAAQALLDFVERPLDLHLDLP